MSRAQRIVLGAWVVLIGLTTVRGIRGAGALPPPSVYLGGGVLMTLLYGAAVPLGSLAAVLAVGADVGAVAAPYLAGRTTGPLDDLAGFLNGLSGGPPQTARDVSGTFAPAGTTAGAGVAAGAASVGQQAAQGARQVR